MNKSVSFVGIDVGKTELWVAVAERRPQQFAHTARGVRALLQWCRRTCPDTILHVCMEATGVYSRPLAVRLLDSGESNIRVSIVNPAQIKAFGKAQLRRTKTDAVDARVILAFAQSQCPAPWTPEPAALRELIQLVTEAEALRRSLGQWHNRTRTHAEIPDRPPAVRRADADVIRTLERQLDRIEQAIAAVCDRDPQLGRQVDLLCSIPGIGQRSAVRLLAYGRTTFETHSAKELTAHAGLAPCHRLSGTSVRGKSHLAKQGDARLRRTLYMPALVAMRHNPILRVVYQRLRDDGKPAKLALVACMRKLLLMAQAILKNSTPFNPEHAT